MASATTYQGRITLYMCIRPPDFSENSGPVPIERSAMQRGETCGMVNVTVGVWVVLPLRGQPLPGPCMWSDGDGMCLCDDRGRAPAVAGLRDEGRVHVEAYT